MIKACDAIIVAQVEIMILGVKPSRDTFKSFYHAIMFRLDINQAA
jgi:hypothetical protein